MVPLPDRVGPIKQFLHVGALGQHIAEVLL